MLIVLDMTLPDLAFSLAQITVRARDHGIPPLSSQAQAIITINRERNVPVFGQTEYKEQKPEDLPVGTEIVTVTATDKDVSISSS